MQGSQRRANSETLTALTLAGFLAPPYVHRANPRMGTKTTFICDCRFRDADDNLGWAHVSVTGASEGKQLMPDYNRDLCMICWSPLQTLLDEVHETPFLNPISPLVISCFDSLR